MNQIVQPNALLHDQHALHNTHTLITSHDTCSHMCVCLWTLVFPLTHVGILFSHTATEKLSDRWLCWLNVLVIALL